MKILMIAPEPYFEPRGTPISVHQRLIALSALGHQVDLLTYHVGESPPIDNVRFIRTPKFPFITNVKVGPSWAKLFLDIFLFLKAITLLLRNQYDLIHSHEEAAYFSMALSKLFGVRHLYDMHSSLPKQLTNFEFGNWWLPIKLFELLEKLTLKSCDAVITIDSQLGAHVRKINPTLKQITIENIAVHGETPRMQSLFASLDDELFSDRVAIVYTGTFESYQGLDLLIESMSEISEKIPNSLLALIGGKPKQIDLLSSLVVEKELEDFVYFSGIVSPEEANVYLTFADMLISPRIDGTAVPLKIYSYLHAGKPIIATDLDAHTQVLDSECAWLVSPTVAGITDGILTLYQNPELRQELSENAKNLAMQRYNPTNYLEKVAEIYKYFAPSSTPVGDNPLHSIEIQP